ncbi:MAG: hypothetical protein Q9P01_10385 [Anaerolineae bacterium]|nr:hypothetical protein [Anaerolineae bacterium]MDQ7035215.1 hypothetical protein [Anaerolineae bacterium]
MSYSTTSTNFVPNALAAAMADSLDFLQEIIKRIGDLQNWDKGANSAFSVLIVVIRKMGTPCSIPIEF